MFHVLSLAAAVAFSNGAPTVVAGTDVKAERMICKRIGDSSSRISSDKVCLTKARWDEIARDNRKAWEDNSSTGR